LGGGQCRAEGGASAGTRDPSSYGDDLGEVCSWLSSIGADGS